MGYELVRVRLMAGDSDPTLQIMAERTNGKGMTLEDCAEISHSVAETLDTDPTLADRYTLEVSSPGIDRPLVRLKDYERCKGQLAYIELDEPHKEANGQKARKRFQGSIVGIAGEEPDAEIEFSTAAGALRVSMRNIGLAKLVLTDALIKAHAGRKH